MNRKIVLLGASLCTGLVCVMGSTAGAFVKLSPERVWDVLPAAIDIDKSQLETSLTDGDNGETAILDAINDQVSGWDGAGSGDLVFGYTTNSAAVQGDGFPTIEFNDPISICTGGCLAATLTGFFHSTSGQDTIDDADCYVTRNFAFTSEIEDPNPASCSGSETYIEGTLQHEIGHMLGLGHSSRSKATMFAFVNACDNGLDELANDDRNGINSLY